MGASIRAVLAQKLGLASHQNAVPLVLELTITNAGESELSDLALELRPSLPFANPKTWRIDGLAPNSTVEISERDIDLDEGYLADLTENLKGAVTLTLRSGASALDQQTVPVELLAKNHWGGAGNMPELLSVFCMPNDPAVDKVLKASSDVLRRAGRPDGVDGYTAESRQRVWELTSALWSAVCGLQLSYVLPPASFELHGQKVRTPSQILDGRVGTCLDTALLFAAALEQAGLNPILILTKGHAFCGVWLQPQEFAHVLTDDASAVRKRVELQELLVFETTLATQAPSPNFSRAIQVAQQQLSDQSFIAAVDVRRARMQRLRPLTVSVKEMGAAAPKAGEVAVSEALEAAPALPSFDIEVAQTPTSAAGKLELWQRKLLDLTTRNRLLHLPDRAKSIRLICPDPAGLEDLLADNKSVRIVPMPDLETGGRDRSIYEKRNQENLEEEFARQAISRSEVPSRLEKNQLEAALVDLYRKAKLDLEEGGSNTLFLALGFLRWKKSESDPKSYLAPLILLPVKLERRSALSGVKMSMLDDEPRFNLTLLELLRHDFQLRIPELDGELPRDQSGINVSKVWNIVRHAVKDITGFEVTTDVALGTFSFAKYLMWRDLIDRTDQLMQNDVVRHLLQHKMGGSTLERSGDLPRPEHLDREINPAELFAPLPADSSQLAAVVASAKDHSFVLDGPPGTGKSQTIANMIAHNLALGRRVLFVAEKMAALDVVKRRLDERGIGEFCLELHSNKSSKLHVLEQLDRAWSSRGGLTEEEWKSKAEKLRSLRDRLNELVAVLHKRWPNGWTVHQAIGLALRDATPLTPRLTWPSSTDHDQQAISDLREAARQLELTRTAPEGTRHPLTLVAATDWSNSWQETMTHAAREAVSARRALDQATENVLALGGLSLASPPRDPTEIARLSKVVARGYQVDLSFAFEERAAGKLSAAQVLFPLLDQFLSLKNHLSQKYRADAIRKIRVDQLRTDWDMASRKFWLLASFAKRKVAKELQTTATTSGLPDVEADLPLLESIEPLIAEIDGLASEVKSIPGWNGLDSDLARMRQATELAAEIRKHAGVLSTTPEELERLMAEIRKLVVDGNELLAPHGRFVAAVSALVETSDRMTTAAAAFHEHAGSKNPSPGASEELLANALAIVEDPKGLNSWCNWRRAQGQALALGLAPLVEGLERQSLLGESVTDAFEVAYARWFAAKAIDHEPLLCRFIPAAHQSDIDAFAATVDELGSLTSAYVRARLSGDIPDKNDVGKRTGYGVLKHELQKQRRHKPVRQLAQEMGTAFTTLAPCMLMSPLSIAQYLPANQELFDLVIFDEASQIAPWDAIGSIARGKQVVIAGDPRQMPPTSFFNRGSNPGDDDTEEDLESVLDECIGAGIPQHSLTWHYRSRHESLIAFSNHHYYGDNLITFPAADTRPSTVKWRKVDGVYARGKERHNQVEAKAIVGEVVTRLTDAKFVASNQSIGIITLNVDQQQLIENLLDQARRTNPAIEQFFGEERSEPVIVKNLETMQGDERDLIILGIGFGPTEPGANTMSMNFGPLNREGGWRRLNVAVTRARREMMIFTSFDPSMIDLSRTSAQAVHDLRHFIEFAEQGPRAMAASVRGSVGGFESPFEQLVAESLRSRGWQAHSQIGVSRFRIDLGIVHPDRPGDYLAGVECDGATYHSAATARDRDKVRSQVLAGLGWRLIRTWSTEWWIDKDAALERLHLALEAELAASRAVAEALDRASPQGASLSEPQEGSSEVDEVDGGVVRQEMPAMVATLARSAPLDAVQLSRTYHEADLAADLSSLQPEMFYDASYDRTLEAIIRKIVDEEAPILDKQLVDRVARAHGFLRSGRIIRERVLGIAERLFHFRRDVSSDCSFIWLSPADPARFSHYRVPPDEQHVRAIEDISPEEIRNAAKAALQGDTALEVARIFGVRRLSAGARRRIEDALRGDLADASA